MENLKCILILLTIQSLEQLAPIHTHTQSMQQTRTAFIASSEYDTTEGKYKQKFKLDNTRGRTLNFHTCIRQPLPSLQLVHKFSASSFHCTKVKFHSITSGFVLFAPFWLVGQTFSCFGIGYELLIFHRTIQFRRVLRGIPCTLAEL